jgi:hypothetical protein
MLANVNPFRAALDLRVLVGRASGERERGGRKRQAPHQWKEMRLGGQ